MFTINENYLKLPGSYLFSDIARRIAAYQEANPDKEILRLGIGDVTQPLAPAIIEALHGAVEEMAHADTFHGYAPDRGYDFLRTVIAKKDFQERGCSIEADEIFISDGAKCDSGNIQEILGMDNMPCTAENNFVPEFPKEKPDVIYLCFPNNPTGGTITKPQLQEWVDYANKNGILIIYDAAYEAYITEEDLPHSIYECEGAKTCAIELRSFSKNAGFTGVRLGFAVVPKELKAGGVSLNDLWARRHGTKYNGAPYIVQKAGAAVYTEAGQAQVKEQVAYYMRNAHTIYRELKAAGYSVYGGVNAPYVWLKTPGNQTSWEFFDTLLKEANVVGTPGSGFGAHGEGYFRLSAFGTYENTKKAMERILKM